MRRLTLRTMAIQRVICVIQARRSNFLPIRTNAINATGCFMRIPCHRSIFVNVTTSNLRNGNDAQVGLVNPAATALPRALMETQEDNRRRQCVQRFLTGRTCGIIRLTVIRRYVMATIVTFIHPRKGGGRIKVRDHGVDGAIRANRDDAGYAISACVNVESYPRDILRRHANNAKRSVTTCVTITRVCSTGHVDKDTRPERARLLPREVGGARAINGCVLLRLPRYNKGDCRESERHVHALKVRTRDVAVHSTSVAQGTTQRCVLYVRQPCHHGRRRRHTTGHASWVMRS